MTRTIPDPRPAVVAEFPLGPWRAELVARVAAGARFGGVYSSYRDQDVLLDALLVGTADVTCLRTVVHPDGAGLLRYPSLTPDVPAAFWYERALHDLSDVTAVGHPRLDPLLLPRDPGQVSPRPGYADTTTLDRHRHSRAVDTHGPVDVEGRGMFSLPLGPVRSGVFESIEFLIETPGETIPHMNIRPHYKHRGIAKRFEDRSVDDGVLVAERVEGVASVAHALAFCHAVEAAAEAVPPRHARLVRVLHAELERVANHLDVVTRLCDAAGLAVPTARFGWHKEMVLRLISDLCGNRFGRNVVRPGGVNAVPRLDPGIVAERMSVLGKRIELDSTKLMDDSTFLDRVRGTGYLEPALARSHGALGPVGRASGYEDDARLRPYDGYRELAPVTVAAEDRGDAQARLQLRLSEIHTAMVLIQQSCDRLPGLAGAPIRSYLDTPHDGYTVGWAEAPQGEVLYGVELQAGRIRRCFARSASLHNLLLFHDVFGHDIFTDFPFIEASFGVCYAGVSM